MSVRSPQSSGSAPQFSFNAADYVANPFPMLEMLRGNAPVFRYELPGGSAMWFVTRFDDAVRVLRDLRFASNGYGGFRDQQEQSIATDPLGLQQSMVFRDEPDHTRLRTLVAKGFTPRLIESLRPRIETIAEELLDQVLASGQTTIDLMRAFAYPLPINVISEMLGVPHQDRANIERWSHAINNGQRDEADQRGILEFAEYVKTLIALKRAQPADDLISSLVKHDDGDYLSEHELLGMVSLLIFAGHETTSNLIGNGTLALLSSRGEWEKLQADLSLVPNAIEELLRYCGPAVSTTPRYATEDIELGGQTIRKGDMVNVVVGSADRDQTSFTDPESLDIARKIERHLAFGYGIHFCLGAPLARLEGEIGFKALLRRLPNLQLAVAPNALEWQGNMVLRGLKSLPVTI
jgi:cytochrome P450